MLTVTELLRKKGVVGKFVEYFGPGLDHLRLEDRATIANMAPEYGATMGFFPVDDETLHYLVGTGRDEELVELVSRYTKEQGLFRTDETPDPNSPTRWNWIWARSKPAWPGPNGPRTASAGQHQDQPFPASAHRSGGGAGFGQEDDLAATPSRCKQWPLHPQARRGGDRRHHQLHQHHQPQS